MDLRSLEAVVAVDEHGSFSAAAQALYISQPALTRRVALLERELNVRLFERTARGVFLTTAGHALLGPARRALSETRAIQDAVAATRSGEHGTLSIIGSSAHSGGVVAAVLAEFHSIAPEVELRIVSTDSSEAAAKAVEAGEYDMAIVELPASPALDILPVIEEEFYAVFAGGGLTNTADGEIPVLTRQMLQGRTMVHLPLTRFPKQRGPQLWDQVGAEPSSHIELADCTLQLSMTRSGRAVAVLPRTDAFAGRAGGLDIAAPPQPIRRTVGWAWHRANASPQLAHFLDLTPQLRARVTAPARNAARSALGG